MCERGLPSGIGSWLSVEPKGVKVQCKPGCFPHAVYAEAANSYHGVPQRDTFCTRADVRQSQDGRVSVAMKSPTYPGVTG